MLYREMRRFVEADLQQVETTIAKHLDTDVPFIEETARYVLSSGGKRIRPVLLVLSARLCGCADQRMYDLTTVIEFIHTATLLHDDVMDNADLRRGNPTVHSLWGNEISILIGDYLYAKAMSLALADKDHLVMKTVSDVTVEMAKGQVIETLKQRDLGISEAEYYRIIALKTASLFAASCKIGAIIGGIPQEERARVEAFGHHLGMAFQMADDTLDFVSPADKLGKPVNNDLKEGKITLPIISLLQQASAEECRIVSDYVKNPSDVETVPRQVTDLLHKYDTLKSTLAKAQEHVDLAKQQIASFAPSSAVDTLYAIADYVTTRDV
jgi:octaprenyl-diphosphate synthase